MFIIHGKRKARIKKYIDNQQSCKSCGVFDLDVKVYKPYYHVFYIPIFPFGDKTVTMRCRNCSEPLRLESLEKQYAMITKTPIYLFATPILIAGIIAAVTIANLYEQKEKKKFVDNPVIGDVYQIRKDENYSTTYYFLRLVDIKGDTVIAYHSNLEYSGLVTELSDSDFFVKDDKLYFLKSELKQMLDKEEINSVERKYGDDKGFNRIK